MYLNLIFSDKIIILFYYLSKLKSRKLFKLKSFKMYLILNIEPLSFYAILKITFVLSFYQFFGNTLNIRKETLWDVVAAAAAAVVFPLAAGVVVDLAEVVFPLAAAGVAADLAVAEVVVDLAVEVAIQEEALAIEEVLPIVVAAAFSATLNLQLLIQTIDIRTIMIMIMTIDIIILLITKPYLWPLPPDLIHTTHPVLL